TQFTKAITVDNRCCDCFCDSGGTKILGKFDSVTLGQIIICRQHKLSVFSGQFNMVKQGSHTLRCTAAFSSASIIYS
ncbi:MAG: hypothetical protein U0L73_04350, partial [Ruminococcus bromii]|nr:hypothetical protein [Ruminococcus bromii]